MGDSCKQSESAVTHCARYVLATVIVSAGKPSFYTEVRRPFREVNKDDNRVTFKKVCTGGEKFTSVCPRNGFA
jgi:hypothetical protein